MLEWMLAVLSLLLGARDIFWRWTGSMNWDAWWFALPLVVAESCAYFGLILFTLNLWRTHDYPMRPAPAQIARIRGRARWRLLVKAPKGAALQPALRAWRAAVKPEPGVMVRIDVDPQSFL